jgi:hypothetical protein
LAGGKAERTVVNSISLQQARYEDKNARENAIQPAIRLNAAGSLSKQGFLKSRKYPKTAE